MKLYHNLILLLVIGLAAVNVSHADVYKYVFESESGTYSEISGGTVHGNTNNDDETFDNINLGFTFTFDGTDYTQVGISCNGFLKFGTGIGNDYFPISNILENDNFNLVSGLGWDLQAQTDAELRTQTIGSAPDRVFVCQWKNYRYYGSSGESYNFQIRLYEGSNRIEVKYGSFTVNQNEYWEVGIKGATDDDYANRSVVSGDNTWATSEAGDSKEDYCEMSSSLQPDDTYSCLVYSWELKPMSYESSEVTQRTGFARIGETDMALLRIQVDMLGTESPLSITELDFDLTGTTSVSDIANAKLYFTGADTEFNTDTQYGSTVVGPGGSFSVSGNQQLEMGENYFWLAIDISSNATEGNFIDAACTALTIGGSDYTPSNSSPTGDIQIFNSLSGDYDIGTGGNYATFAEVFEVCNAVGLSGNVRLNVVSNITETEQAYLESWDEYGGTGYSMTIRPDGGSRV
ncbi:MAG: BNR-repeat neuraminidase N-terminal domain-containing protein, partial [Bacteroidota bacterium]